MPVFVATLICHLLNLNYECVNTHINVKPREGMPTSILSWAAGNYDLVQEKWHSIHKYWLPVRLWGGGGVSLIMAFWGWVLQSHVTFAASCLAAPRMCRFTADNTPSGVAGSPVPKSPPVGASQGTLNKWTKTALFRALTDDLSSPQFLAYVFLCYQQHVKIWGHVSMGLPSCTLVPCRMLNWCLEPSYLHPLPPWLVNSFIAFPPLEPPAPYIGVSHSGWWYILCRMFLSQSALLPYTLGTSNNHLISLLLFWIRSMGREQLGSSSASCRLSWVYGAGFNWQ